MRWQRHRSFYQHESAALLVALGRVQGKVPRALALRLEGFLGHLHKEWFPATWRRNPTYAEVVADLRWWLKMAEGWSEPRARGTRAKSTPKARVPIGKRAKQPASLLKLLRLPADCTQELFLTAWRRFVKAHHPDHNPDQTADERRRFAEAVALWRR
ncbi:MAG: J domain-containing protein [Candidatus Binatia bacterium]